MIAEQSTLDGTGTAPAVMIGYEGLIPRELIAELAASARLRPVIHPADSPPEAGYVPSRALAEFVKCRDLTCRFPGCTQPATMTDVDHTVPHARGGPTQAGNLKCLCRHHHLVKTFWGWKDQQLRDGTVIWTSPAGDTYVTHPGSAYLFPELCAPTAAVTLTVTDPDTQPGGDRTAMMPRRHRTRDKQRAADIACERAHNHQMRTTIRIADIDEYETQYAINYGLINDPDPPF